MRIIKNIQILFIFMLLQHVQLVAQPAENPQTFCNPLNLNYRFMVDAEDAREAADAVIVLFKDNYYLFASRSGGYWSSPDLRNWELIVPEGIDVELYAPGAVVMRDTLFYIPGNNSQVYKTADPKSGIWEKGPKAANYGDPAFFLDDDGRLYMCYGLSNVNPTGIVELDPFTFKEISSKIDVVFSQASIYGWERRGDDNLFDEEPWIEGTWMVKYNNKYYMHYSGPGTEFKTYADGIYVADSPLGPYQYAPYSPFAFKPTGFISGAGHGSTFQDKQGKWWHVGTMAISINHMFERRLGLFPVTFDDDGQIRCNTTFGDYPQYNPGAVDNHIDSSFAEMVLLSHKKYALASSSLAGYGVGNAVDEESRTFWSAVTGDPGEWLMVDLGKECSVEAIQVNFGELNTDPDLVRGRDKTIYEQYYMEISNDGTNWEMLVDKSQNMEDVPHDYIELAAPVNARYLKITNVYTPGEGNFAIRGFRIFGNSDQAVFTTVDDFTVERDASDGRDAVISWSPVSGADGYVIHYGIAPDKLYNNYIVYDTNSVAMHSLNHGTDYYFSVTAFESGTDYYRPVGEFRSYQSGNWHDVNTWSKFDGSDWVNPAPNIPSATEGPVSILTGHRVVLTVSDSIDQLIVDDSGTLVIEQGVELNVMNNVGDDLSVSGNLINAGSISPDTLATISFVGNGSYEHAQNGGSIPKATWRANSTCLISRVVSDVPGNLNQDFYNLHWICPDQSTDIMLGFSGNTIGGNILVDSTGTGMLQMCDPSLISQEDITIHGDIVQTDGKFIINTPENHKPITIHHGGNINVSGGVFAISSGTGGGGDKTLWNIKGNVNMADASTENLSSQEANFVFVNENEVQNMTISNMTFGTGGFPIEVASGVTFDMGTSILQGDGNFNLKSGATLMISHKDGINGCLANTGNTVLEKGANYVFAGSQAQVTGILMPDTVTNVTINNMAGLTLSKSVVVNGTLEIIDGTISSGSNKLVYGPKASLKYAGTVAQTTTSGEFPASGGPNNLIVDNPKMVTLHDSRTVQNLKLNERLELGANTLTFDSITMVGSSAFVLTSQGGLLKKESVGNLKAYFPVGTTSYTPVWITNTGTEDNIGVSVKRDSETTSKGNSVRVKWEIVEDSPGGGDYTIEFGWPGGLESSGFRADRENKARIFNLADTSEVGTGDYSMDFSTQLHSLSRGGITELGTFGVGTFEVTVDVEEIHSPDIHGYNLSQNYPNPFLLSTQIGFKIPEKSHVSLKVYNSVGEEIDELVNIIHDPGTYNVQFDASNLPYGIYYYTIRSKNYIKTKRMILMK